MSHNLEENIHSKDWEEGFNRGLARGYWSAGILIQNYMNQLKDYYKPDSEALKLFELLEERVNLLKTCLD